MGFFKDFADDFQEAVDELIPGTEGSEEEIDEVKSDTSKPTESLETDINAADEYSKLDGLLEKASARMEREVNVPKSLSVPTPAETSSSTVREKNDIDTSNEVLKENTSSVVVPNSISSLTAAEPVAKPEQHTVMSTPAFERPTINVQPNNFERESIMEENLNLDTVPKSAPVVEKAPVSDENAVITGGMRITGDLESVGSVEVEGTINGNVTCNGKITVTGVINGNSNSSEFFADQAKVQGEVASTGTVKIGVGSVVIGNITASSAVIAGAVKGDIDVQGPVVVDTSAVVMGNIKSRSVQINNGAVIEGFCSQAYAEVDVESVFS